MWDAIDEYKEVLILVIWNIKVGPNSYMCKKCFLNFLKDLSKKSRLLDAGLTYYIFFAIKLLE